MFELPPVCFRHHRRAGVSLDGEPGTVEEENKTKYLKYVTFPLPKTQKKLITLLFLSENHNWS